MVKECVFVRAGKLTIVFCGYNIQLKRCFKDVKL